jgi:endonuclease/exonuclease/phosphatase family metal-dependent hydrolase
MMKVRVATLNTWKGEGLYTQRMELISQGFLALNPDIVMLQEVLVSKDGRLDTGRFLADRLDLAYAFQAARLKPRVLEGKRVECYSGLAVLSRGPMSALQPLQLSDDARDGDRYCQLVSVELPVGSVTVANTHLTHLSDRDDLRLIQMREIVDRLSQIASGSAVILGGDFNATDTDSSLGWLMAQRRMPLVSVWREAVKQKCISTMNRGERPICIDHIFRSDPKTPALRWHDVNVALAAESEAAPIASDHLAVHATLGMGVEE